MRPGCGLFGGILGCSRTGGGSIRCPLADDQDDKSRMTGDGHVRICGSREVRSLPATRPGPVSRVVRITIVPRRWRVKV